jgi:hypothetical protein
LVVSVKNAVEAVGKTFGEGELDQYLEGVDEKQYILGNAGLKPEARKLYLKGRLTVGKLLLIQPSVITKNTDS